MIRSLFARPAVNLAVLLVFNLLTLSIQLRNPGGQVLLKTWAWELLAPVASASTSVSGKAVRTWEDYVSLSAARKQNRRLQQENYDLRMELQKLRELDRLHSRVEDYRRFQSEFQYTTVVARVVGKSPPFWKSMIVLNVGSNDGVRTDNAVVTPVGIVGRVLSATASAAEAELITNTGAAAGVLVGEGRIQGITQGIAEGTIGVRYIPSQEQVRMGDVVVTSGTDRVYPAGLPVGRVSWEHNSGQIYKDVHLRPAVNLANLQEVLVITGYHFRP